MREDVWQPIIQYLKMMFVDPSFLGSVLGALIGAVVTGGGLFFAWLEIRNARHQYQDDLRWRRSEFVRGLLVEMTADPNIALICRILDWREGPALIPVDFRSFFKEKSGFFDREPVDIFEIDWNRFVRSLAINRDPEWRHPDLYTYRTCFDSFCSFIQRTAEDLRSSDVAPSQFADLGFYCHRIVNPLNKDKIEDHAAKIMFNKFIMHYYNKKTYDIISNYATTYEIYIEQIAEEEEIKLNQVA